MLKDNLKAARLQAGMTLDEVAQKVGVSRQTIQRYESGVIQNIPSDNIEKIANILGVSPGVLMGWESPDHTAEDIRSNAPPPLRGDARSRKQAVQKRGGADAHQYLAKSKKPREKARNRQSIQAGKRTWVCCVPCRSAAQGQWLLDAHPAAQGYSHQRESS